MALTTYNITGNLEDALGAKATLGEVTFMPAGTTQDARVDGADAMLGPIRYSLADLPSPMPLTEGAWIITIRATGRVNGEAQFRTKTIPWNMTAATTWGAIVASAAAPVPLPAPTFDESVAGVLGTGGQTDAALSATYAASGDLTAARRAVPHTVDDLGLRASTTGWFDRSRRGLFVHYVFGGTGAAANTVYRDGTKATTINQLANDFDVTRFVADLQTFGVDYVIFTAWHYAMHAMYPSAVMDTYMTGHSTTRDLIRDLIDALRPTGIKLVLYVHPLDGNDLTAAEQTATGWNDATSDYATWATFINDLITECGERYGDDLDGFWVDMLQDSAAFEPRFVDRARLRRSLKAGNPNRALISNRGISDDTTTTTLYRDVVEHATYEYIDPPPLPDANGAQNSLAMVIGSDWFATKGEGAVYDNGKTPANLFRYLILNAGCNKFGGGTIYAAGPYAGTGTTSMWEPGVEADLDAVAALIDPIRESLDNVKPSASWPTANTVTLNTLGTPGYVAVRSADDATEYVHVLNPPASGSSVTLAAPVDGAEFYGGVNLRTGNPVTVTPTSTGVKVTLAAGDTWDANDTVIALSRTSNYAERAWVGAESFGSNSGANATFGSQSVSGRYAAWSMSPTTDSQVEVTFALPKEWNTFRVALYLAQPSAAAGTGAAVLSINHASVVPGGATNVDSGAAYGQAWTMPGNTTTLATLLPFKPLTNKPDSIHHVRIARNADDVGDTGPTLAVVGLMAYRVS